MAKNTFSGIMSAAMQKYPAPITQSRFPLRAKRNGSAPEAEAFLYADKKPAGFILSQAVRIIIAIAGSLGTVFTFLSCIDTGVKAFPVTALIIISCAVFGTALSLSERLLLPALGAAYAVYAAAAFALRGKFAAGLANVVNIYLENIDIKYAENPFFDIASKETAGSDISAFILLTSVFIALAFSYGIVYRGSLPAVLAVSAPPAELCLLFGLVPDYFMFFVLTASWFAAIAIDLCASGGGRTYRKAAAQCGIYAAVTALLCAGIAALGIRVSGYARPERLNDINDEVTEYFKGGGFSEDIAEIKITEFIKRDSTVNHGKLGDNGNITFSNETALRVTMPKTADTVYLRGYVGSVYTGRSWEPLPAQQKRELEAINASFSTDGLSTLFLDSYNLRLTNSSMPEYSFSVDNIATHGKYLYMPYNLVPESVSRYRSDADVFLSGGEKKWFGKIYNPSSVYGYRGLLNTAWIVPTASLKQDQNVYMRFVHENYLDLPEDFKAPDTVFDRRYYDFITAEAEDTGKSTLTDAVVFGRKLYYIKSWLRDNCEYSLKAGKLPAGKDFADYFITETRKGSCTHFATSAALLCRYAGIPARYAEGYVIKPSDFDSSASFGSVCTVDVTDARAHAWTEVYIDGFGWYPIEFTSGYGNVITAVTTEPVREETTVSETETEEFTTVSETEEVTSAQPVSAPQPAPESTDSAYAVTTFTGTPDAASEPSPAVTEISGSETSPAVTKKQSVGFSAFGKHNGERRDIVYDLTGFILAAFIISSVTALTGLRRVLAVRSSEKAVELDSESAARSIYKRFEKLTKAAGMKPPKENFMYSDYIKQLEGRGKYFADGIAETVINTALKAEFGGGAVTADDIRDMYRAVGKAVERYEKTLSRPKKFFVRFILGIV